MSTSAAGHLRAPSSGDSGDVAELFARFERSLYTRSFTTDADITSLFGRPRFDPDQDAWLVFSPEGRLTGYAEVWEREAGKLIEALGVVDPDHVGRGLGALLLDLHEARARARAGGGNATLRNVIPSKDRRAADLLLGSGYERVRRFQHMAIDLGVRRPSLKPAAGVVVRGFDVHRDANAIHRVLQEVFAGAWEFAPTQFDRWKAGWIDVPTFDPKLWFLAEISGKHAGAAFAMQRPVGGWIIDVGVLPAHRGKGIGAALMIRVFDAFRERGTTLVELNVDAENPTGAVRLYERLGMTVTRSWDLYDKQLG